MNDADLKLYLDTIISMLGELSSKSPGREEKEDSETSWDFDSARNITAQYHDSVSCESIGNKIRGFDEINFQLWLQKRDTKFFERLQKYSTKKLGARGDSFTKWLDRFCRRTPTVCATPQKGALEL